MCSDTKGFKSSLAAVFKAIWGTDMELHMSNPGSTPKPNGVGAQEAIDRMAYEAEELGRKLGMHKDPVEQALEEIIKDLP